jgi:hypothetical protein
LTLYPMMIAVCRIVKEIFCQYKQILDMIFDISGLQIFSNYVFPTVLK